MKKVRIAPEDKALIKAYAKWCSKKGFWPTEKECSDLIDNHNDEHRWLVEYFLADLREVM